MSIGTLFAFAVVCVGVLVLRITQPNVERPFKAPVVWLTAPLGALFSILMMIGLPRDTWYRLAFWMALGLLIYFLYGMHHSKLGKAGSRRQIGGGELRSDYGLNQTAARWPPLEFSASQLACPPSKN